MTYNNFARDNEFVIVLTCVLNHVANCSSCNWKIWDSVSCELLDSKYCRCFLQGCSKLYEFMILQYINSTSTCIELIKYFQLRKTKKIVLYMNYIATVISNRSNGPPTFASNGRCMERCFIESKNDGGNIISSLHSVLTIFVSSLSMWSTFNLLEHKSLKKWLISVSVSHILFGKKSRKANGISVCINTWQSWLFIPYNLHSSVLTSLDMFEACPSGKRRLLSHL